MNPSILSLIMFLSAAVWPKAISEAIPVAPAPIRQEVVLAQQALDLTTREPGAFANEVFSDNILLALHYLKGDIGSLPLDWEEIRQSFAVSFVLEPGETFAFHDNVLPEFPPPAMTFNSRFFIEEGYRSVGGLGGNGVCHLASQINWVASGAGLEVTARASHDFAPVPGVPKENGTSIRSQQASQNLYIKNDFDFPVIFIFEVDSQIINLKILQG